jgi:hypothetical protein
LDERRFTNPAGEPETDRSMRNILRWYRAAPRTTPIHPYVSYRSGGTGKGRHG